MRRFWTLLYPGIRVKRWFLLSIFGIVMIGAGIAIGMEAKILGRLEDVLIDLIYMVTGRFAGPYLSGVLLFLAGLLVTGYAVQRLVTSIMGALMPQSSGRLMDALYYKRYLEKGPKVVALGGGTGLSTLLRGLKAYTSNITAVVTVADDGGSSGRLREELGILPPGDFRNCLVALADTEPMMEKLFQYRFPQGSGLAGHSFGNLFIAALTGITGDFETAVQESSGVLAVLGQVLPSTLEDVRLHAEYDDGMTVTGESNMVRRNHRVKRVFLSPDVSHSVPRVIEAIKEADLIVLGPGSLYTSVIPPILVSEVAMSIRNASALKVYICNIMTQPGETDHYSAHQHLQAIWDHADVGFVDMVVVNNEKVQDAMIQRYQQQGSQPVKVQTGILKKMGVQVMEKPLISSEDLARHDSSELGRLIYHLAMAQKIKKSNPLIGILSRFAPRFLGRYYHTGK
jgi:uncharacterized cofD-like protein